MNIDKIIKLYTLLCIHYFYVAYSLVLIILIINMFVEMDFKTFLIFEFMDFKLINVILYLLCNGIVLLISRWIINKKLKRNFICIVWIGPLFIQVYNLIKIVIS